MVSSNVSTIEPPDNKSKVTVNLSLQSPFVCEHNGNVELLLCDLTVTP